MDYLEDSLSVTLLHNINSYFSVTYILELILVLFL